VALSRENETVLQYQVTCFLLCLLVFLLANSFSVLLMDYDFLVLITLALYKHDTRIACAWLASVHVCRALAVS